MSLENKNSKQNQSFTLKISKNKLYFVAGILLGVVLSLSAAVYAASQDNAWNIGDGWMWFATASDSQVHANVQTPVDDSNVTNKSYVDAAGGSGACYEVFGKAECAEGWQMVVSGYSTIYNATIYSGGGLKCSPIKHDCYKHMETYSNADELASNCEKCRSQGSMFNATSKDCFYKPLYDEPCAICCK